MFPIKDNDNSPFKPSGAQQFPFQLMPRKQSKENIDWFGVAEIDYPDNAFVFADPHFDHTNIIKYCNRPFKSTNQMNKTILENYNKLVHDDSIILFLGDMAYGRDSETPKTWLRRLRGQIYYMKGNHDDGIHYSINPTYCKGVYKHMNIACMGYTFMFIHDPDEIVLNYPVIGYKNWIIHGHKHNHAPFFNIGTRRINVSVENTNYGPMRLSDIIAEIEKNIPNQPAITPINPRPSGMGMQSIPGVTFGIHDLEEARKLEYHDE